jgi:hypothetical protein
MSAITPGGSAARRFRVFDRRGLRGLFAGVIDDVERGGLAQDADEAPRLPDVTETEGVVGARRQPGEGQEAVGVSMAEDEDAVHVLEATERGWPSLVFSVTAP